MSRLVSNEDKRYMQELYADGMTVGDIAYITGYAHSTVSKYLEPRKGHMDNSEIDAIVEMFHNDFDIAAIASVVGRSKSTVHECLKKRGLRRYRKYTIDDYDAIVKLWNELKNKSAVARIVGCERKKVVRVLKKEGLA